MSGVVPRSRVLNGLGCALVALAIACPPAAAENSAAIRWAFASLVEEDGETHAVRVVDGQELSSGDAVKFMFQPLCACRVYLIREGPGGEVSLLFPYRPEDLGVPLRPREVAEVPRDSRWLELDERTGRETWRVLVSLEPFAELDGLLRKHAAASGEARDALAERIRTETSKLARRYESLARPAQKGASIGGSIRGAEERWRRQVREMAVELRGRDAVCRTLVVVRQ